MKSFLCKGKRPIMKWGMLENETHFKGNIPEGFSLAISPTEGYVIIDVDRHGDKDGFKNIPKSIKKELDKTFHYATKNDGMHYWIKYSGKKHLFNKASKLSMDLRTNRGYVIFYKKGDIRDYIHLVNESSTKLNKWLHKLFG